MFFYLSKIFWFVVNPGNLFLLVVGLGFIASLTKRFRRLGQVIMGAALFCAVVLSFLPIGNFLLGQLENRFPFPASLPENVDGIIVLGGVVDAKKTLNRGQTSFGGAIGRLTEFNKLAKEYPEAKLVFTGGSGSFLDQEHKEAHYVTSFLTDLGLDTDRIIFEDQSRNTWENAVFSKESADVTEDETWILITSAFHMPRSVGCFRKVGWKVVPYPVAYRTFSNPTFSFNFNFLGNLGGLSGAIHEWIGLVAYYWTGKTSEIFPSPIR